MALQPWSKEMRVCCCVFKQDLVKMDLPLYMNLMYFVHSVQFKNILMVLYHPCVCITLHFGDTFCALESDLKKMRFILKSKKVI